MYHAGNKLIDPDLLFQTVGLQGGMHTAVFGTGRTGHIVFPAARIVGENGIVYAVDIMRDILKIIQKRAADENIPQVHTVWSDLEQAGKTAIPKASLDIVFLVNILLFVTNREAVLTEAMRLTKPYGRILVVDWARIGLPFCPPKERFVNFVALKQWALKNNLTIEEEFSAGKYHAGVVLTK